jgi:oxidase EvaA
MPGIARNLSDLRGKLDDCRQGFELKRVGADRTDQWALSDGALQHVTGGFFSVNGVRHPGGEALLLYQPQAAVTGIVTARRDGLRHVLMQGRAEPGCLGEVQFGPTVQSTPANYMRAHGGASTPYVDAFIRFLPTINLLQDTTQLDLGERYLFKTKRSIVLDATDMAEPQKAFIWAGPAQIREAVLESAFLNIDLRSVLAIMDWSADPDSGEVAPAAQCVRASLDRAPRAETLGAVMADLSRVPRVARPFMPLTDLANWQQTEMGWSEKTPEQGFAVDYFEVKAAYREVGHWVQPLINSASEGHAVLACRLRDGRLELCVRAAGETGLATSAALLPTHLRYPGVEGPLPDWLQAPGAKVLTSTVESDEGGRFFRDASRYELVLIDEARPPQPEGGHWLSVSELKVMLATSCLCSIQLRGLASHLLAVADP